MSQLFKLLLATSASWPATVLLVMMCVYLPEMVEQIISLGARVIRTMARSKVAFGSYWPNSDYRCQTSSRSPSTNPMATASAVFIFVEAREARPSDLWTSCLALTRHASQPPFAKESGILNVRGFGTHASSHAQSVSSASNSAAPISSIPYFASDESISNILNEYATTVSGTSTANAEASQFSNSSEKSISTPSNLYTGSLVTNRPPLAKFGLRK